MRPRTRKVNAGGNGNANGRKAIRVNEKFCEGLVQFLGKEKLIDLIRFLHELEDTRPRVTPGKHSKSDQESGNGIGNG
jgi:hypothetical protein